MKNADSLPKYLWRRMIRLLFLTVCMLLVPGGCGVEESADRSEKVKDSS